MRGIPSCDGDESTSMLRDAIVQKVHHFPAHALATFIQAVDHALEPLNVGKSKEIERLFHS